MAKAVPVEVRVADVPQMRQFIGAVAALIKALAKCHGLPDAVMEAADEVRQALVALGGRDIGPPPGSEEDRIRTATNVARENPGRVVTVTELPDAGDD